MKSFQGNKKLHAIGLLIWTFVSIEGTNDLEGFQHVGYRTIFQ